MIPKHEEILKNIGKPSSQSTSTSGLVKSPIQPREVDFRYGGQYLLGEDPQELIKADRGYGGYDTKKGYQRDHIFPVSLGGTSNAANIHYLEMSKALYKDKVVRYAAKKVRNGELPIGSARTMVMNWENEDIPGQKAFSKKFGGPQNFTSNFLKSLIGM